ncbi:MAG: SdrD B-like domain-containing protein, partial [Dehalococcoidia bacterium]
MTPVSSAPLPARTCPRVSGYVYHDVNDNGLRDPGEPPLGGGAMELRAADGSLAGSTRAAEDGYYEFFFDATAEAPEERSSVTGDLLP